MTTIIFSLPFVRLRCYAYGRIPREFFFYEILKHEDIVTVNLYKGQLQKLNEKIQELTPHDAHTPRKVLFLYDNARSHIAIATKDAISQLGWEPFPHSAYSPNLAPSDYHLFRFFATFYVAAILK